MNTVNRIVAGLLLVAVSFSTIAAPREIVIIRHADKWMQPKTGPFLSPKGQLRAERFSVYYLKYFPKPDYIFATKPGDANHPDTSQSVRPLQTVAPLANQLAYQNATGFDVLTPYYNEQYDKLASLLLKNPKYNQKMILICWHHGHANRLATALGVTTHLKKWAGNNFDMVYVLKYSPSGKLASFQILENQYPVTANPTWDGLATSHSASSDSKQGN